MKSRFVLAVYLISCLVSIVCNTIDLRDGMLWSKVIIVPAITFYYILKNDNNSIGVLPLGILFCFYVGDIYILLNPNDHTTIEIYCFFSGYTLLLIYLLPRYLSFKLNFTKNSIIVFFAAFALTILSYFILSLEFEQLKVSFSSLILYGIVLSLLMLVAIIKYFGNSNKAYFNLMIACLFFCFSDSFYIITKFYLSSSVFNFVQIATQVFSYYFLVQFFILKELKGKVLYQNRFSLRGFTSTRI